MKLAVAVVHNRDRNRLANALVEAGFKFTVISSTGGFLREGNATLLVGLAAEEVGSLKELLRSHCSSREQTVAVVPYDGAGIGPLASTPVSVPVGGAVLFVMDVEDHERF